MKGLPYYLAGGTESILGVEVGDIQQAFVDKIQSYLPDNPVVWVSLDQIRHGLDEQARLAREQFGDDVLFVTLSSLYYDQAEAEISCTRVVTPAHEPLGIVCRPNALDLREQIQLVMESAGNRPIVVVDDTLFHGDTVRHLQKLGLRIDGAVEYFAAVDATQNLREQGIDVFPAYPLDGYLDEMPIHDFLPGMPLSGKLIGQRIDGEIIHLGVSAASWSFPYVYPYIPPHLVAKWASIPWDFVHSFSAFAIQQTAIIVERLSNLGVLTIDDLRRAQPHHVNIPFHGQVTDEGSITLRSIIGRAVHHCMVA